jgi:release factor family 10
MALPTLQEVRELSDWQPPLGVVSVYLGFDPADRGGAWRSVLRSGVDRILRLAEGAEHERKVATRETAGRLLERFEEGELRPPPRGEVGFLEVGGEEGAERWWGTGVAPSLPGLLLADRPVVMQLVDLCRRGEGVGVALPSAERVRLLDFREGELEELDDRELSVASLAWRARKAQSARDPARGQGVTSSGHDRHEGRLEHSRRRFLVECGRLAGKLLDERSLGEVIVFGPPSEAGAFCAGLEPTRVRVEVGGEADLVSAPKKQLVEAASAAVEGLRAARDQEAVERVLGEVRAGGRGAAGLQETVEALAEGRVESVFFDPTIGDPAETLVRGAFTGGAGVTVVRDGVADLLGSAEGVAALLRY